MNNVTMVHQDDCYGCTACYAVCPLSAISIKSGIKGFPVPSVDKTKCVDCGLCVKTCPKLNSVQKRLIDESTPVYAVKHKDESVRMQSTSGGAFSMLVQGLLSQNVIVYGAASDRTIRHIRVADGDISVLRKSKYVQSSMENRYTDILNDLRELRTVLFVGTPCQCAGLINFLETKKCSRENLYTIDFVCHGTQSPKLYEDYLKYSEAKAKKKIVNHEFRNQDSGWHSHTEKNFFSDGTWDTQSFEAQLFTRLFYTDLGFKETCYKCEFASKERCSDITIGDFWGIEKAMPEIDDNIGVSLVVLNNKKGEALFELSKQYADCFAANISMTTQAHLDHPVARPTSNDNFWSTYQNKGFKAIAVTYLGAGKLRRTLSLIYYKMIKLLK